MKRASLSLSLLLLLNLLSWAQKPGTGGGSRSSGGVSGGAMSLPRIPTSQPTPLFISGNVVVDDGSELTDQAVIQSICKGRRHMEGYTDSHGSFTIEMGRRNALAVQDIDSDMGSQNSNSPRTQLARQWSDCELQAVLPGFTSQVIELGGIEEMQNANVGRIVLHRLSQVEGFTISATSANAPESARKAYTKGRELEDKKKWEKAEEKFKEAVKAYPRYAVAWSELGRVQIARGDLTAARESFQHSLEADGKLVTPHQELARIAFNQKNWNEVVDQTNQVLALNPISFPYDWFLNSAASYFLGSLDAAEKSARSGLKADVEHRFPKLEYVLGAALLAKRDYAGAREHMNNYVRLAPNDPEVPKLQKQIAELDKVVGTPAPASSN